MVPYRMSFGSYPTDKFQVPFSIPADAKKTGLGTVRFQDIQHLFGDSGRGTVIKSEKDFMTLIVKIPGQTGIDLFDHFWGPRRLHSYCI
jgi:hypothetical protein